MGVISKIHSYDEEKISFEDIDEHVSMIDITEMENTYDVFDYIKKPIARDDENRNIYLARAIVRLIHRVLLMDDVPNTVLGKLIISSFTATFDYMCSRLDIPCQVIQGEAKDFTSYRHETYPAVWCAFMSNGRWHLVDLVGILSATTFHETGGRIMLESDGVTIFEKQEEVEGVTLTVFNDFWFCTNPSKLIFYDFPDDQEWTLLSSAKTSKELKTMPFTYLKYHVLGLQFITECFSRIHAKDGQCTISLNANPSVLRSKCFPYTLSLIEGTGDISGIKSEDVPLLVRYAPGIDTLSFNIRFPVSGEYVFEVSVKDLDNGSVVEQCFDIVIVCDKADPDCRKLPIDAGIVGFGYGHKAKEAGLKNPSKASPTVNVNQETESGPTVLTFQIGSDFIDTVEYGSDVIADDGVNAFSETHVDAKKGKLTVVANVKTEGEVALSLTAKHKQSNDKPDTVLNYLLTTRNNGDDVEYEKLVKKRKRDLVFEEKMEERITMKKALTNRIIAIEKEIEALRNIDETFTAAENASLEDDEDVSERYVQSNAAGNAEASAVEISDNITGNKLSEKAEKVSKMNPRYVQSNAEGNADTSAVETNDTITGKTLLEKAEKVSTMNRRYVQSVEEGNTDTSAVETRENITDNTLSEKTEKLITMNTCYVQSIEGVNKDTSAIATNDSINDKSLIEKAETESTMNPLYVQSIDEGNADTSAVETNGNITGNKLSEKAEKMSTMTPLYVRSNEEGNADATALETNDNITGNTLSEKAETESTMNPRHVQSNKEGNADASAVEIIDNITGNKLSKKAETKSTMNPRYVWSIEEDNADASTVEINDNITGKKLSEKAETESILSPRYVWSNEEDNADTSAVEINDNITGKLSEKAETKSTMNPRYVWSNEEDNADTSAVEINDNITGKLSEKAETKSTMNPRYVWSNEEDNADTSAVEINDNITGKKLSEKAETESIMNPRYVWSNEEDNADTSVVEINDNITGNKLSEKAETESIMNPRYVWSYEEDNADTSAVEINDNITGNKLSENAETESTMNPRHVQSNKKDNADASAVEINDNITANTLSEKAEKLSTLNPRYVQSNEEDNADASAVETNENINRNKLSEKPEKVSTKKSTKKSKMCYLM